jgi:hypothetical protein
MNVLWAAIGDLASGLLWIAAKSAKSLKGYAVGWVARETGGSSGDPLGSRLLAGLNRNPH